MPWDNSLNPSKGRDFQLLAATLLAERLGVAFQQDYPIAIGHPPKFHKFDLVSQDLHFVGECKNYSWTETGMRMDRHDKRKETLVQYYLRTYKHLLGGLKLYELDPGTGTLAEHAI